MPLTYALIYFSMSMPLTAQRKRDIHGFATGMSTRQVTALAKGGCDAGFSCKVDGGDLKIWFQSHASSKLVTKVVFEFKSGTGPEEMVSLIAKQFGRKPGEPGFDYVYVGHRRLRSRKVIGKWDLGDQLYLRLGFSAGDVNDYVLELRSKKLEAPDAKARVAAEEKAKTKSKATNPSSKF